MEIMRIVSSGLDWRGILELYLHQNASGCGIKGVITRVLLVVVNIKD